MSGIRGTLKMVKKIKISIFILISFLPLLFSCAKPLYKDTFLVAGTFLEVISPYKEASRIVLKEIQRLEGLFNFYDPGSELSQLNQTYARPFKASPELIELLTLAKQIYTLSDGALDVSQGALYSFWKEFIKQKGLKAFPDADKIERLKNLGGMEKIEIDPSEQTVFIKQEGLKIDLSAIAQGYMVDRAVGALKRNGIDSALINLGGEIYALGRNRDKPWRVGIKNPRQRDKIIEKEILMDEAIATSGTYEQFFAKNNRRFSHLIDPRSGYPVDNTLLSVSVISRSCATADGFATAFLVMGQEKINDFFKRHSSGMRVFVVLERARGLGMLRFAGNKGGVSGEGFS